MESVMSFNPRFPTPSPEVQEKLRLSMKAAEGIETRYLLCPVCQFKVRKVPVGVKEIVFVKCQKCKFEGVLHTAYFRRMRSYHRRLHNENRRRIVR